MHQGAAVRLEEKKVTEEEEEEEEVGWVEGGGCWVAVGHVVVGLGV